AVAPGLLAAEAAAVAVVAGGVTQLAEVHGDHGGGGQLVVGADRAVDQLHGDVVVGEGPEGDDGGHLPCDTELGDRLVALHRVDVHVLPRVEHPRLPGRQRPGPGVALVQHAVRPAGDGVVHLLDVVTHHAAGDHAGPEAAQRRLDPADPPPRHGPLEPVVEQRHDLALEQVEQA